jgi:hypothetical protein
MKIQDVIHYYIGCKMVRADYDATKHEPYILHFEVIRRAVEFGDKPILHRLADLSEGNIIDLLQCMFPDEMEDKPTDDEYSINMFHADGGNLVNSDVVVGAEWNCRCMDAQISIKKCGTVCLYDEAGDEMEGNYMPRVYHYLLQHHFDIFGLIDAGLAIDSKTIKG